MKPLNSYVLIEIETQEEKTSGGLYVPQGSSSAVEILKKGKVVDISKKVEQDDSNNLAVGDIAYYNKHAITKVPEHNEWILVRFEDLYGYVK